jgi:hypothetical protein
LEAAGVRKVNIFKSKALCARPLFGLKELARKFDFRCARADGDLKVERFAAKGSILYLHYMDDVVILARMRWHLKRAIREVFLETQLLGLQLHQEKRFSG